MKGADETSAVATAKYFMELYEYAMRSGDLTEWNYVSGQTCKFCENTAAHVAAIYTAGHHLTGRTMEITDGTVRAFDEQMGVYSVLVSYTVAPGAEVDASGSISRQLTGESGRLVVDVLPSVRGWVLMGGSAQ
jgi:hypothetical protein